MRGVQTYRNPNTGETVELSNRYEHAWVGPDNQYVVTDSTTYNPNYVFVALTEGDERRLQPGPFDEELTNIVNAIEAELPASPG